ncbi:unnamed protein product, partial [Prunus brigantina]
MMSVFTPLLKKGKPYIWSQECQEAYQQVQQLITKLPTMKAPVPGLPLKLYLAATNAAVGALLAQDGHDGEESPIYYVSQQLRGAEARYPKTKLLCLALVYAAQRLRHYFLAHKLQLIVKSDPGQVVIDMLALFPEVEGSALSKEVLGELPEMVATVTEEESWTLYFDGSSTSKGGGAGVVLINPNGQATALSFKLDFPCTNNVAKYEAFIMGLSTAREMGAEKMKIIGDSNLDDWRKPLKKKLGEESSIKDLKDYVIIFGELYRRLPGGVLSRCVGVAEARRRLQEVHNATCSLEPIISLYRRLQRKEDWRTPYLAFFVGGTLPTNSKLAYKLKKTIKRYFVDGSTLYRKGFNGEPLKCLGESEARQAMQEIHAGDKMVYEYQGSWSVHLPDALWAYRTSPRSAIGFSPYSLVYGSEAISPVEITIPTARVAAVNDLEWDAKTCSDWRLLDLEAADERRMEAERRMALYHKTVAQAYNRTVKP